MSSFLFSYLCFERSKTQPVKNVVIPLDRIVRLEKGNQYSWIPGGGMIIEVFVQGLDRVGHLSFLFLFFLFYLRACSLFSFCLFNSNRRMVWSIILLCSFLVNPSLMRDWRGTHTYYILHLSSVASRRAHTHKSARPTLSALSWIATTFSAPSERRPKGSVVSGVKTNWTRTNQDAAVMAMICLCRRPILFLVSSRISCSSQSFLRQLFLFSFLPIYCTLMYVYCCRCKYILAKFSEERGLSCGT